MPTSKESNEQQAWWETVKHSEVLCLHSVSLVGPKIKMNNAILEVEKLVPPGRKFTRISWHCQPQRLENTWIKKLQCRWVMRGLFSNKEMQVAALYGRKAVSNMRPKNIPL